MLGKYRAQARYRPVYALADGALVPAAAQGAAALTLDGAEVAREFALDGTAASRLAFDLMGLTLIMRNHRLSDAGGLDLLADLPVSGGEGAELALELLEELAGGGRERTVVFLAGPQADAAGRLRAAGFRIGLRARLEDAALADGIASVEPEIIRLDGDWLRHAGAGGGLGALLGRFVAACRDAGARVMLPEVDSREALAAALGLGADFFAGDALGPATAPAAAMDLRGVPLAGLTVPNVLPFRRRG